VLLSRLSYRTNTESWSVNHIKLSGILGLVGAILCGTGEFLLHFDECRLGLGETGFDFMINTSETDMIKDTNLIDLYNLRCESLLNIIRVTTLVISVIYIKQVLTGQTRYPKWMSATSPIVLLVMNFIVLVVAPEVGRYVAPIALNVGFSLFFMLSLTFGNTGDHATAS